MPIQTAYQSIFGIPYYPILTGDISNDTKNNEFQIVDLLIPTLLLVYFVLRLVLSTIIDFFMMMGYIHREVHRMFIYFKTYLPIFNVLDQKE